MLALAVLLATGGMSVAQEMNCAGRAGLYAGEKGLKFWVTRTGTLSEENPLRPLSPTTLTILEVVVNGRAATAIGPDVMNLRQAGPAARVAAEAAEPIRWRPAGEGLPVALRLVGEDGRVAFDGIRFAGCEDAPKPAAEPSRRPATRSPAPEASRPRPNLPQGAIP